MVHVGDAADEQEEREREREKCEYRRRRSSALYQRRYAFARAHLAEERMTRQESLTISTVCIRACVHVCTQEVSSEELLSASALMTEERDEALRRGVIVRGVRYELHRLITAPATSSEAEPQSGPPWQAVWGRKPAEVPEKTVGIAIYNAVRYSV